MLSTERLRLVDVMSNWPVRFFWRLAPVVPAPLIFAWAVIVPLSIPLRSGWKEFTSGARGTACALRDHIVFVARHAQVQIQRRVHGRAVERQLERI